MYKAYISRASEGDMDNTPIIDKILALRNEKAQILGFKNFSDLSMASKVCVWGGGGGLLRGGGGARGGGVGGGGGDGGTWLVMGDVGGVEGVQHVCVGGGTTPLVDKILALRQEKAQILGFKNFSDLSMASKMCLGGGMRLRGGGGVCVCPGGGGMFYLTYKHNRAHDT